MKPKLETALAAGVVILADWMTMPNGYKAIGICGHIEVMDAKSATGIEAGPKDSTWVAVVSGSSESLVILGCQIRAVHTGKATAADFYHVP